MPSASVTEPVGPRSVDEMLGVVYGRAHRLRRRRAAQRLGGGVAALAVALTAFVMLGEGDDSARLRVVDDRDTRQTTTTAPPDADPGAGAGNSSGYPPAPSENTRPRTAPTGTPPAAPPVTSPPNVQADAGASLEAWMSADDVANDAVPNDWYYDVIAASMEFDRTRNVVVFTTRYRSPDTAPTATRAERVLESLFDYGTHTYVVTVEESGNRLSGVRIEDAGDDCTSCTAHFEAADATLVVTVPLGVLNAEVARHDDSPPLGSGSEIADLTARTARLGDAVGDADVTGQGGVQ
ncbi:MAG: hypothetical protein KY443_09630 [Actinobacteria bacterium]|nr:hypothetical protein [Actinomycetota bacterium]